MMLNLLLLILLGYIVGRLSHVYLNVWTGNVNWLPHHWIYAIILMIIGIIYWPVMFAKYFLFFGIGFFISDLKDFLKLKVFEPDKEGPKKFWDID